MDEETVGKWVIDRLDEVLSVVIGRNEKEDAGDLARAIIVLASAQRVLVAISKRRGVKNSDLRTAEEAADLVAEEYVAGLTRGDA